MRLRSTFLAVTAAVLAMGFSASSAETFEPTSEAEKLLVSWLEERECSMTQSDFVDEMTSGNGLPGPEMMKARREMTKSGFIRRTENNGMSLVAGSVCGDVEIAEPKFDSGSERDVLVTKLMSVFEENGCLMPQRRVMQLASDKGMTDAQIDIAGEALEDAGAFKDLDTGLQLLFGKCKGVTPDISAAYKSGVKTLEVDGKLAVIVSLIEENECILTQENAEARLAAAGIESSEVGDIVRPLLEEGHLIRNPGGDGALLVSGEVCG